MNGTPGLPGKHLPPSVLWPLLSSGNPLPQALVVFFFIYYSFSISAVLVLFQENWNMAGPWYLHFLTPNIFLAAVTGTVPTATVQLGQDGGDGTYFLVLIKAQLWGLCFFNVSSYQCFVVRCCYRWLSTNVESVWNFRESRLICRPGPLYLKGLSYFYYKVVS